MEYVESVEELKQISGVYLVRLKEFGDERGRFIETWRRAWVPGAREMVQTNRSDSRAGTLRGMHYHLFQADYWNLVSGRAIAGLYDFRASSPTSGQSATIELADDVGVYIPPGVAHGFYAVTDATMTYFVDQVYDGSDELGFRWDDPALQIDWPDGERILSERDQIAPLLADVEDENRPD
ncbi:MAG TPA: dTDP-4-dehydrorhamnose 3,5-epimerase [Actinomycetota bacterium]|nr:dTDP-4-dehydrorhamnose 3,5-epimerase [Actinomycetota bacterium]